MNTIQSSMKLPDEPVPVAASSDQGSAGWSWPARATFMFTGVILPTIGVIMLYADALQIEPRGQSADKASDCARLLLTANAASVFCPFLLYSMTCMAVLVFAPGRFLRSFVVRFGVYTGVLLAVQYWVLSACVWFAIRHLGIPVVYLVAFSFGTLLIPWGVWWAVVSLFRKFGLSGKLGAVLVALTFFLTCSGLFFSMVAVAPWAAASYSVMAVYAARQSGRKRLQFSLAHLLGVVPWLAAYLGAWRISVLWMLEAYANLR